MRLKKDIRVVLMMMVVAYLASLCPADAKHPTVAQLLDKYTQALDSTSSFIGAYKLVGDHRSNSAWSKKSGTISYRGRVRHDNQRFYYQKYMWGYITPTFPDMSEDMPMYNCSIINGREKWAYYHNKNLEVKIPGKISLGPYSKEYVPITMTPGISYLTGYINSDQRLDTVLRKADRIIVRQTTEKVGGSDCFVLEADTKHGQYKLWLDPEHGFHPAKMRQSAKEGNYRHHKKMTEGMTLKAYLDSVRFEKIDGIWVPMEADAGHDIRGIDKDFKLTKFDYHYKRTVFILNPDHDKLGSFADPIFEKPTNDPELTNGTRVRISLSPNSRSQYTWQDGKLIDKNGNKVDMQKFRKETKKVGSKL